MTATAAATSPAFQKASKELRPVATAEKKSFRRRRRRQEPESWSRKGYDVYLEPRDAAGRWAPRSRRGVERGDQIVVDVPAGTWRLVAIPVENGVEKTTDVTVAPAEETVVDLRD